MLDETNILPAESQACVSEGLSRSAEHKASKADAFHPWVWPEARAEVASTLSVA